MECDLCCQSGEPEFTTFVNKDQTGVDNDGGEEDPTRGYLTKVSNELGEFLARPIRIHTTTWGTGLSLSDSFVPWTELLKNPRIINRINNNFSFKAKLKLRIVMTGNPFLYGRALVYYNPLNTFDDITNHATLFEATAINQSQKIHAYLNPTLSQTIDLDLPFVWFQDYCSIISNASNQLGTIYIRSLTDLVSANDNSMTSTVTFYAWFEDAEFGGPTAEASNWLVTQSGELEEAAKDGIISGPATAIAKVADSLGDIPIISKYAKATSAVASSTAKIARMFGYSRPSDNSSPMRIANTQTSSFSVANEVDLSQKMTLDSKQELSIDPSIGGAACEDPLAINAIAGKESYITQFPWTESRTQDDHLWNIRTSPVSWQEIEVLPNGRKHLYMPACSFAAMPFENWRGTIYYRFQVACSALHKGQLKLTFDPYHTGTPSEDNVAEQLVVDIAETPDFVVGVKNGRQFGWLRHHYPGYDLASDTFDTARYTALGKGSGILGVSVMNQLTSPSPTPSTVQVIVSMWAGDDFEVAMPSSFIDQYSLGAQSGVLDTQSGVDPVATNDSIEPNSISSPIKEFGQNIAYDSRYLVNFGESVPSFRLLIKRFSNHETLTIHDSSLSNTSMVIRNYRRPAFPYPKGTYSSAPYSSDLGSNFAFVNNTLLNYVTSAFCGRRGSVRWKYVNCGSTSGAFGTLDTHVGYTGYDQSCWLDGLPFDQSIASYDDPAVVAAAFVVKDDYFNTANDNYGHSGLQGMVYGSSTFSNVLEFEVPYYSRYRFDPQCRSLVRPTINEYGIGVASQFRSNRVAGRMGFVQTYCAAGEDFQVYQFNGAPVLTYWPKSSYPNPV
jgi:hypothetical protein